MKKDHLSKPTTSQSSDQLLQRTPISEKEMDDMILHCNQNTIYVLNTSYNYGEFDMIGLFGTPAGRSLANNNHTATSTTSKLKSKTNSSTLLENQINDKFKESNNNLLKKRPNFLKFFNDSFMKNSTDDASSESSCKSSDKVNSRSSSNSKRKSSKELYREAAEMLGISCQLTDDCRCLDCQSRYFDCDDDSDTYSNLSNIHIDDNDLVNIDGDNQNTIGTHFYCNGQHNCNYVEDNGID